MSYDAEHLDDEILEKAAREALDRPRDAAFWDDRLYTSHGPVLAWAQNGGDLLAESNYVGVLRDLTELAGDTDDVIDAGIGHWAVGPMRQLFVRVRDEAGGYTEVFREAVAIALALQDYPVYDEDDYGEREWAEFEKDLEDALRDAVNRYEKEELDYDILPDDVEEAAREQLRQWLRGDLYRETGEGDPGWCRSEEIDYDEVYRVYAEAADRLSAKAWEVLAHNITESLYEGMDELAEV